MHVCESQGVIGLYFWRICHPAQNEQEEQNYDDDDDDDEPHVTRGVFPLFGYRKEEDRIRVVCWPGMYAKK